MCCLPLKSVLQADALFLHRTLEVRDRSQAAAHNATLMQDNDWPLVGHLQVRIQSSHLKYIHTTVVYVSLCQLRYELEDFVRVKFYC